MVRLMANHGTIQDTPEVDRDGDYAESVALCDPVTGASDDLTGATARATLTHAGGVSTIPMTTVVGTPNFISWKNTASIHVATTGVYTLKVYLTRATQAETLILTGSVLIVP